MNQLLADLVRKLPPAAASPARSLEHAFSDYVMVFYYDCSLSTAIVVPIAHNPAIVSVELGLAFYGSTLSTSSEKVFDALKLESMRVHNQEVHDATTQVIDCLCNTAKLSKSVGAEAFQPDAFRTEEVVAAEDAMQAAVDAEEEAQELLEEDDVNTKQLVVVTARSMEAIEAKRALNEARHKAVLEKLATLLPQVSRPSMLGLARRLGDGLDKSLFAAEKQLSKKASPQTVKASSARKTVSGDSPDGGSEKPKSAKPKKAASKRKFVLPKVRVLSTSVRKEWTIILTSAVEATLTPVPTTRILDRLPIFDLYPWDRDEYHRLAEEEE